MNTRTYYYARVSSKEQNLDRQIAAFISLGAQERDIITDKESGKNRNAYEVVANNINFCGSRNGGGNGGAYAPADSFAPASNYSRPAMQEAPAYSAGSADDFAIIDDSTDLPF